MRRISAGRRDVNPKPTTSRQLVHLLAEASTVARASIADPGFQLWRTPRMDVQTRPSGAARPLTGREAVQEPYPENPEGPFMPATTQSPGVSVVLVHGGFVDGSGWEAVYRLLRKDGYK